MPNIFPTVIGISQPLAPMADRKTARVFTVCGIVHVSTSPNSSGRRVRASVAVPGRVHEIVEPLDAGTFSGRSVSIDLDGDTHVALPELSVTLTQQPLYSPIDFTTGRALPGLSGDYPLNHYQQVVRTRGTCTVAGESHESDGLGWRDRVGVPRRIGLLGRVDRHVIPPGCLSGNSATGGPRV